jgi:hypothetical protein
VVAIGRIPLAAQVIENLGGIERQLDRGTGGTDMRAKVREIVTNVFGGAHVRPAVANRLAAEAKVAQRT